MIPLKDDIPTGTVPIITICLIVTNIAIFLWGRSLPQANEAGLIQTFALVPRELLFSVRGRPDLLPYNLLTIFTSMFLHGGFLHLGGNMLYLWIFGNNIEDSLGRGRFLLFYLASGLIAALVQVGFDPLSAVPMVGASGAVSGILGAYLLLFPTARVKTLIFIVIFVTTVEIPAMILLTIWFLMQILFSGGPGVAWFAHIGGFVFGLLAIKIFLIGKRKTGKG